MTAKFHIILVLAFGEPINGINAAFMRSPVMDEERMRPGHWFGSVLCVYFSALTSGP